MCVNCFNFTRGFADCFACSQLERHVSAMVPISYSVGHEYLHHILADYKRLHDSRAKVAAEQLSALLSMFLVRHEACVAHVARVECFDLVTTVPSSDPLRDENHPLRRIVGEWVETTRNRHDRLLLPTLKPIKPRVFAEARFRAVRRLNGENVLLIDDTWTTGASVQSAAASLKEAGAASVSAVVVGRHLNRGWHENDQRLEALPFDWTKCAVCAGSKRGLGPLRQAKGGPQAADPLQRAA